MRRTINTTLGKAAQDLQEVIAMKEKVTRKERAFAEKIAAIGATVASINFSRAVYDGDNDVSVSVEPTEDGYKVIAKGQAVAFIEFGTGAKYGGGYPKHDLNPPVDTNPGSWSTDPTVGKGHYDDPNGWFYEHGKRSWGNPPNMAMYYASKEMKERIAKLAKEVFEND